MYLLNFLDEVRNVISFPSRYPFGGKVKSWEYDMVLLQRSKRPSITTVKNREIIHFFKLYQDGWSVYAPFEQVTSAGEKTHFIALNICSFVFLLPVEAKVKSHQRLWQDVAQVSIQYLNSDVTYSSYTKNSKRARVVFWLFHGLSIRKYFLERKKEIKQSNLKTKKRWLNTLPVERANFAARWSAGI